MFKFLVKIVLGFAIGFVTLTQAFAWDNPQNSPNLSIFQFTVYSARNIDHSNSDYQGIVGAAGNVRFRGFGIGDGNPPAAALYVGGDLDYQDGGVGCVRTTYGRCPQRELVAPVYVDNRVTIRNFHVTGPFYYSQGSLGNGSFARGTFPIRAGLYREFHARLSQEMFTWSDAYAMLPGITAPDPQGLATFGPETRNFQGLRVLELRAFNGRQLSVFQIDVNILRTISAVRIVGFANQKVLINVVGGGTAEMRHFDVEPVGGIGPQDILWNFPHLTQLEIAYTHDAVLGFVGTVLAPRANFIFYKGLITGSVLAGNLATGQNGQVNYGPWIAPPTTPTLPPQKPQSQVQQSQVQQSQVQQTQGPIPQGKPR